MSFIITYNPALILLSASRVFLDTLQLLFQVHGEISSAMVSLSVRNHTPWRRGLIYDSLIIDLPNGERMALKGNISHTVIQSYKTRLS